MFDILVFLGIENLAKLHINTVVSQSQTSGEYSETCAWSRLFKRYQSSMVSMTVRAKQLERGEWWNASSPYIVSLADMLYGWYRSKNARCVHGAFPRNLNRVSPLSR